MACFQHPSPIPSWPRQNLDRLPFRNHRKFGLSRHIAWRTHANTNFSPDWISRVGACLEYAGLEPRVMVDCSHANSAKDHRKQPQVCHAVAGQIEAGEKRIMGVMLESNLVGGAQQPAPREQLIYGQSITDSCMGWEETLLLLRKLAKAASSRKLSHPMKAEFCVAQ